MATLGIEVNGEARTVESGTTVSQLVAQLGIVGLVAVERNKLLVPRAQHANTVIHEGDVLEIVHFVGGG